MKENKTDSKRCELIWKTVITCNLEGNCIPELVKKESGGHYFRSPKAKNRKTQILKKEISSFLCE